MSKGKITKTDLSKGVELTTVPLAPGFKMDLAAFNAMEGELFAGLNILKLQPGTADGPFTITAVLKAQQLNKKLKSKVDVYVAKRDGKGAEIRMPASKGFVMKAADAKLKVGDTFAVARGDDYDSKFKTKGQSYQIKVLARA
jgi:hypothetical protein